MREQRFKCPYCTRELDEKSAAGETCPFCFTAFGPTSDSSATAIPEEVFSRGSSVEMEGLKERSAVSRIPEELLTRGSAIDEDALPEREHSAVAEIPDKLIERRGAVEWANAQAIAPEPEAPRRKPSRTPMRHLKPREDRSRRWPWIVALALTAVAGAAAAAVWLVMSR